MNKRVRVNSVYTYVPVMMDQLNPPYWMQAGFLKTNDRVFGFADSGHMDAAHVADFLDHLPDGVTELYCHPATRRWAEHPMPEEMSASPLR